MKNFVILFVALFAVCVYALFALEGMDCPKSALFMAKSGIVVSLLGILYAGYFMNTSTE